jgi:uncharacterized membrane protein YraQ (UPF0718 family)
MEMLLRTTLSQFLTTLSHNWPYLVLGTLVAAALKLYVNQGQVRDWIVRNRKSSIFASTGVAIATPLCSCGSMAVILGMLAATMPWAPIVAFMVSSPLTSPQQLLYSAGLFGWPFALTFFGSSIVLGLAGGFFAQVLEAKGWLANQHRFCPIMGGSGEAAVPGALVLPTARPGLREFLKEVLQVGRHLFLLFSIFAFIGYLLNNLIPAEWILGLFGAQNTWGVALAATLGLPLYFSSEASMPLIQAFIVSGASPGAALAFLITGAGTSLGAISGALAIARWRVVGLVIAVLWIGAVLFGYGYNLLNVL